MTLGLGMQHWGLGPIKVYSNDDLGLILIFFMARSNLLPYAFATPYATQWVAKDPSFLHADGED